MKSSEDFLFQFAKLTSDLVFIFDLDTKTLIYANDQLYSLLGFKRTELSSKAGALMERLIHPEDLKAAHKKNQELFDLPNGSRVDSKYRLKTQSGKWVPVLCRSLITTDHQAKKIVIGTIVDLSEQIRFTEQNKKEGVQVLQNEKLATVNDMAGGIAHEINNPLAIILGRAQAMKMRIQKGAVDQAHLIDGLDTIEKTVQRISNIISALRLVTRDGSKDAFVPTQLKAIIQDIKTIWTQRLLNNGVNFSIVAFDDKLTVTCRPTQIATSILNLLSNAYLAVKDQASPKIVLEIKDLGDFVEVAVVDSGPGVPEDLRRRIFNPFFTTRPVGEGTGLGLTVAAGVLREHKGEIYLDYDCPSTRFAMRIPKNLNKPKTALAA